MKRLWLVRLGRNGEAERPAQEQSLLTIDFAIREDISSRKDREAILDLLSRIHLDAKTATLRNYAAQINQLVNVARTDDLVVSPMKSNSTIWVGRISGDYLTCHGIFPPPATRVRPKEGTDDEANDTNRRADHWHSAGA